ncbi:hypothetical protein [Neomoorella thermoacetica]|uniref:hypothetical protein n=1 Tax=Neomoorella thermoacetica TaxID=1525 RepID=UPI0008FB50AA|nr:hypothetical protein [Moorella thermoacetica]APC09064.1 hypothetical protein MTJW_19140 [Moorella thermoacetica]OIQ54989.1 hypothetical protein MORE_07350 [Moorella thermoacetica]
MEIVANQGREFVSENFLGEKGIVSPLIITVIIIIAIIVMGMSDIFFAANNVADSLQQSLDTVGTSALAKGLRWEYLRNKHLQVDEATVRDIFIANLKEAYHMSGSYPHLTGNGRIKSIDIVDFQIKPYTGSNRRSWGFPDGKARDFVILETVAVAEINVEKYWDLRGTRTINYREYGTNAPKTFTVNDQPLDGVMEIPVHSVSRIVLR